MTIVLAHADSPAGNAARAYALKQATLLNSDIAVKSIDGSEIDLEAFASVEVRVMDDVARSRDVVGDFLDEAGRLDTEMIVVGIRHRSPVGKMLLGSSTQRIILEANAPVVAVKPTND